MQEFIKSFWKLCKSKKLCNVKNFAKFSSFILQSVQSFFHPFCKECKLFFSHLANPKETFFFSTLLTGKNYARPEKKKKQHLLFFQQSFCFFFCSLFFFYRCPKRKFSSELFLQVLLFFCSRLDLLKVKRKQNWVLGGGACLYEFFGCSRAMFTRHSSFTIKQIVWVFLISSKRGTL